MVKIVRPFGRSNDKYVVTDSQVATVAKPEPPTGMPHPMFPENDRFRTPASRFDDQPVEPQQPAIDWDAGPCRSDGDRSIDAAADAEVLIQEGASSARSRLINEAARARCEESKTRHASDGFDAGFADGTSGRKRRAWNEMLTRCIGLVDVRARRTPRDHRSRGAGNHPARDGHRREHRARCKSRSIRTSFSRTCVSALDAPGQPRNRDACASIPPISKRYRAQQREDRSRRHRHRASCASLKISASIAAASSWRPKPERSMPRSQRRSSEARKAILTDDEFGARPDPRRRIRRSSRRKPVSSCKRAAIFRRQDTSSRCALSISCARTAKFVK